MLYEHRRHADSPSPQPYLRSPALQRLGGERGAVGLVLYRRAAPCWGVRGLGVAPLVAAGSLLHGAEPKGTAKCREVAVVLDAEPWVLLSQPAAITARLLGTIRRGGHAAVVCGYLLGSLPPVHAGDVDDEAGAEHGDADQHAEPQPCRGHTGVSRAPPPGKPNGDITEVSRGIGMGLPSRNAFPQCDLGLPAVTGTIPVHPSVPCRARQGSYHSKPLVVQGEPHPSKRRGEDFGGAELPTPGVCTYDTNPGHEEQHDCQGQAHTVVAHGVEDGAEFLLAYASEHPTAGTL